MSKVIYALRDNRMPLYMPFTYVRGRILQHKLQEIDSAKELDIMLTFDVEQDFGSAKFSRGTADSVLDFLPLVTDFLKSQIIKSTFFVQGNLIARYHKDFLELQKQGYELGLHGYCHEPWGSDWFINERLPSIYIREKLLVDSLEVFKKYKLPQPKSFRAPNMVINKASLKLFRKYGFKYDSSAPSYRGIIPIVTKDFGITEIPVSVNPIPEIRIKKVPSLSYNVLNMHNLIRMSNEKFLSGVETISKVQKLYGQKPFLVLLAHSWEFCRNVIPYCSELNFDILLDKLSLLKRYYAIRYKTIEQLEN